MTGSDLFPAYLSCAALLVPGLSAFYAWKANDIGRLNALFAMRAHYLSLMEHQSKMASILSNSPSGLQAVHNTYADLDTKLRDVSGEINRYHSSLVKKHT